MAQSELIYVHLLQSERISQIQGHLGSSNRRGTRLQQGGRQCTRSILCSSYRPARSTIGHVPREISMVCSLFLNHQGTISCEIIGRQKYPQTWRSWNTWAMTWYYTSNTEETAVMALHNWLLSCTTRKQITPGALIISTYYVTFTVCFCRNSRILFLRMLGQPRNPRKFLAIRYTIMWAHRSKIAESLWWWFDCLDQAQN